MTRGRGDARRYRIDLRFQGRRLLVTMDGPDGPEAERHLTEVRAAAAECDLDVVVRRPPANVERPGGAFRPARGTR